MKAGDNVSQTKGLKSDCKKLKSSGHSMVKGGVQEYPNAGGGDAFGYV